MGTLGISEEEQQKLKELVDKDKSQIADAELTSRVQLALKRKYDSPEWALFFEVTGKNGKRADAIAYNLFPSRNFKTYGFEIKVSRADWKKELENGAKADYFVGQCDEWYVVAGRKGIVKESELPTGWGLLEMKGGGKLYKIVESDLTDHQNRPMDREFYARGIQKAINRTREMKAQKRQARREGYREGKKDGAKKGEMDYETKNLLRKGEKLEWLEDHGIHIWQRDEEEVQKIKDAIDVLEKLESGNFTSIHSTLNGLRSRKENLADEIDEIEEILCDLRSWIKGSSELHETLDKANESGD